MQFFLALYAVFFITFYIVLLIPKNFKIFLMVIMRIYKYEYK